MMALLVVVGLTCCPQESEVPVPIQEAGGLPCLPNVETKETRQADLWLAYDKVQHVTFSFLWTLSSQYALEQKAGWRSGQAWPLAAGTSAAMGLAKELYDWKAGPRRHFSYRDLVANGLGIALAVGFILL